MRIIHNLSALNAWRNVTGTNSALSKSLEKLSSGFRINKAADDPAGLVISEKLRSQISGVEQAINNTQDAIAMIQTAEGAMTEIHTMLNSMRALAVHAANTGATSATAIAADQQQVDSAIESIQQIVNTTAFIGKKLLDGTSGNVGTVLNTTAVASVTPSNTAPTGTNYVNVVVTTAAERAFVSGNNLSAGNTLANGGSITVQGVTVSFATGTTVGNAVAQINAALTAANKAVTVTLSGGVHFTSNNYGSSQTVSVFDINGILAATGSSVDSGSDIVGTINGESATGNGLTLTATAGTSYAGMSVTMTTAGNVAGTYTNAVMVQGNAVQFQIGGNKNETKMVSMASLDPSQLGTTAGGIDGLNSMKTGGAYSLATDPQTAIDIIEEAIDDVSTERAKLGALQKNLLESTVKSLSIASENFQSAESRIRDVDMAKEMVEFTKNQILLQAGTAMLAQANVAPQGVLQLLR
jgi:flagellin